MAERRKKAPMADTVRPQSITVGDMLRQARESKKLTLEDVSAAIHIRTAQLRAIEEGNLSALPGMTYAVGFIRNYASYLGLSANELVHKFKSEHVAEQAQTTLAMPEPIAESRMPDPVMVGIGAFLAVLLLIVWSVYSGVEEEKTDVIAEAVLSPEASDIKAAVDLAKAETITTEERAVDLSRTPEQLEILTPEEVLSPPVAAVPEVVAIAPVAKPAPPAAKVEPATGEVTEDAAAIHVKSTKSRITLKAKQASFIDIKNAKDDSIFRKVLRSGEVYHVPDEPGVTMITSNAGGIDVEVDGKAVQPLGGAGEILRGVAMNADELKVTKTKIRR